MSYLPFLHPLVRARATACPVPTVDHALVLAARELCRRTRCWRVTIAQDIDTASQWHDLDVPVYARIFEIESVWFDGNALDPAPYSTFTEDDFSADAAGAPCRYTMSVERDRIAIVPRGEGRLVVNAFLMPELKPAPDDTTPLPNWMTDTYGEAIAAGALADILSMPGQPWTDGTAAMQQRALFERSLDRNFADNIRGPQRAMKHARAQYF